MAIKSIRFPNAHNKTRKDMLHAAHVMVTQMKAHKEKGDHIEVVYDNGQIEQYMLVDHAIDASGDALTVNVTPGVEP